MKLSPARRLCEALEQLLDDSDPAGTPDPTLRVRIQVVVNQLALLAEDPEIKEQLREPIEKLLQRWQDQIHARSVQLLHLHAEIERMNHSRAQLAGFSSSYGGAAPTQFMRLRALA